MSTVQHVPGLAPCPAPDALPRVTAETRARNASAGSHGSTRLLAAGRSPEPRAQLAVGPSRHVAKYVSAALDRSADDRVTRRHVRYAQRGVLWRESRLQRIRYCGRITHGGDGGNVVTRLRAGAPSGGSRTSPPPTAVAHFSGLQSCGSIWACPVCSAKIRNGRANEISAAAAAWDLAGNSVVMMTLTFPHDLGMRLAALLPIVADGFRALISGRPWRRVKDQVGIVGTIRSIEVTHGGNGWHPHAHVLVYVTGEISAEGIAQLAVYARARWAKWITKQGYRVPHDRHGVDIGLCTSAEEAGAYVSKTQDGRSTGNELARGDMKQGRQGSRTPFEILDDFRWTGDVEDLALWHEYEQATKGHQAITWSKGLRGILGVGQEQTDEELAAEEVGGDDIAMIPAEVWAGVVKIPGLDAALLDVAERSGRAGMDKLLARHGLDPTLPPGVDVRK